MLTLIAVGARLLIAWWQRVGQRRLAARGTDRCGFRDSLPAAIYAAARKVSRTMSTDKTTLRFHIADKQAAAELLNKAVLLIGANDAQKNPTDDPEERRFWAKVDRDRLLGELTQAYGTSMREALERVLDTCCTYRDQQADLTDDSVIEDIASAYCDALYLLGEQERDEPTDSRTTTDVAWSICNNVLTPLIERAAMALDIDPTPIMLFHEAPTPENRPGAVVVAQKLLYAAEARPAMSRDEADIKAPPATGTAQTRDKGSQFTVATLRDMTGLCNETIHKYAKRAGVVTPGRGKRNWVYSTADMRVILQRILLDSSENAARSKCYEALRNLK